MIRDYSELSPAPRQRPETKQPPELSIEADTSLNGSYTKDLPLPPTPAANGRHSPISGGAAAKPSTPGQRLTTAERLAAATAQAMEIDLPSKVKRQGGVLDELPVTRVGRLLTLDLKGNDIRVRLLHLRLMRSFGLTQAVLTKMMRFCKECRADREERRTVYCTSAQTQPNAQGAESERQPDRACWSGHFSGSSCELKPNPIAVMTCMSYT